MPSPNLQAVVGQVDALRLGFRARVLGGVGAGVGVGLGVGLGVGVGLGLVASLVYRGRKVT